MKHATIALVLVLIGALNDGSMAQTREPKFDVVSIRRNTGATGGGVQERPDGGLSLTNVSVATLITRAYPPHVPVDIVGLPEWARQERYDVVATASLPAATQEDRLAMLRTLLAERFQLAVHMENREHAVYDLVLARSDGRLGPGLAPSDVDCAAQNAARDAATAAAIAAGTPPPPRPQMTATSPLPPCMVRLAFTLLEAQATMPELAVAFMRMVTSPMHVVDKTGLTGTFNVRLEFDPIASRRGPDVTPQTGTQLPTLFTAVQEQLGLRLVPSRGIRETLIIDRLERPSEN